MSTGCSTFQDPNSLLRLSDLRLYCFRLASQLYSLSWQVRRRCKRDVGLQCGELVAQNCMLGLQRALEGIDVFELVCQCLCGGGMCDQRVRYECWVWRWETEGCGRLRKGC